MWINVNKSDTGNFKGFSLEVNIIIIVIVVGTGSQDGNVNVNLQSGSIIPLRSNMIVHHANNGPEAFLSPRPPLFFAMARTSDVKKGEIVVGAIKCTVGWVGGGGGRPRFNEFIEAEAMHAVFREYFVRTITPVFKKGTPIGMWSAPQTVTPTKKDTTVSPSHQMKLKGTGITIRPKLLEMNANCDRWRATNGLNGSKMTSSFLRRRHPPPLLMLFPSSSFVVAVVVALDLLFCHRRHIRFSTNPKYST